MVDASMGVSRQPSTVRPSSRDDALDDALALQAALLLHGQERHAHAILAGGRQSEAQADALARKELVRDLDENAGAVAGFRIAAAGAAVGQVDEDFDALDDDVVRLPSFDMGDEPDSAGIMFVPGVV